MTNVSHPTSTLERNSTSLPYDVLVGIAVFRSTGPGGKLMHKYSEHHTWYLVISLHILVLYEHKTKVVINHIHPTRVLTYSAWVAESD